MAKYDGLIIPRSYNDYINKSDPLGVSQALQLTGVMDDTPTAGSSKPVKSSGLVGLSAVDVVETGNMHPVTSNAVAETAADLEPVDEVTLNNMHSVTSNALANFIINLAGSFSVSLSSNGYTNVDVQLGQTLPNTDYILQFSVTSTGSILFTEMSRTTTVVRVNVRNLNDATLTVNCNWFLICKR